MLRVMRSMMCGVWALEKKSASGYLPVVEQIISGVHRTVLSIAEREEKCGLAIRSGGGISVISEYGHTNTPEDARGIAVIGFQDVITKYDQESGGPAGMITKNNLLQRALANPKVDGVVLYMDSPGGEALAGGRISSTIRNQDKPVFSFVDGMSASAAFEFTSASTEIYLMDESAEVGSIGSYVTIADYRAHFEARGIKLIEMYAEESSLKNYEVREALKGNEKPLQEYINKINDLFLDAVKQNRGDRITDGDAFKGKLFMGSEAVNAGAADGIANFDSVIGLLQNKIEQSKKVNQKTYYV